MNILHVFTLDCTPKAFFDGQFRYLVDNGGHQLHLVTSSPKDNEFCNKNSLDYTQIELARSIDIKADLKSIRKLYKLIKKEKFDAVFGHTPKGAMVAMIASKLAGVKNRVYYRHGLIYTTASGIKRKILKAVERFTSSFASKIINVSPSLGDLAVKDRLNSAKKQLVIGKGTCGGIDAENLFNPGLISASELDNLREKLGIGKTDFIIGFCGRICKEKGIRELIDGFKLFQEHNPDVKSKLLLVGEYDERDILPKEYKDIIVNEPDIISTGNIDKRILPKYYSLMDIFVFPSYREGFGMSVIEAGAMEVPALVSRSHGCVDSIVENETGEYIDISLEGIAYGIERMVDLKLRKRLGKNSREYVLVNYDCSILWPKILKFYNSVINKS